MEVISFSEVEEQYALEVQRSVQKALSTFWQHPRDEKR